jgi:hypothetical protein
MGGLTFTCNLLLGHLSTFAFAYNYCKEKSSASSYVASHLLPLLGALELFFVLSFSVFLLSIKRKYISSFFSTMTAPQFSCHSFRIAKRDHEKMLLFLVAPTSYYESIFDEVREYLAQNWQRFNDDTTNRNWFTPRLLEHIPAELFPECATPEQKEANKNGFLNKMRASKIKSMTTTPKANVHDQPQTPAQSAGGIGSNIGSDAKELSVRLGAAPSVLDSSHPAPALPLPLPQRILRGEAAVRSFAHPSVRSLHSRTGTQGGPIPSWSAGIPDFIFRFHSDLNVTGLEPFSEESEDPVRVLDVVQSQSDFQK